jgi:hypothetical protein
MLLDGLLPVEPLCAALEANPNLFDDITANLRNAYPGSAHRATQTILLRWCFPFNERSAFEDLRAVDYPALAELIVETAPLVQWLMDAIGSETIGRVMINKLAPHGHITPHVDEGAYAEHFDRFHIVIQSDDGNHFQVGQHVVQMLSGQVWWFNHRAEHSVKNTSERPRIHLIVDAVAPQFRP